MGEAFKKLKIVNLLPDYKNLNSKKLEKKIQLNFSSKNIFKFNKYSALNTKKKLIKFCKKVL